MSSFALQIISKYIFPTYHEETKKFAIIGHVGSTNTRFQLIQISSDLSKDIVLIDHQTFQSQTEESLHSIMQKFIKKQRKPQIPVIAVLAVAGPIEEDQSVSMTNVSHWPKIVASELRVRLKLSKVILLNDFQSISLGVLKLKHYQVIQLNKAEKKPNKPIAVFGPGTGLGEAVLASAPFQGEFRYYAISSEGGHKLFSPEDEEGFQYQQYLKKVLNLKSISCERIMAGQGLQTLYNYFSAKEHCKKNNLDTKNLHDLQTGLWPKRKNEDIINSGVQCTDEICRKVVDFYIKQWAKEVSNLGISFLTYSGVYIVGSLPNIMREYMFANKERLWDPVFFNKEKMKNTLAKIPVYIVLYEDMGLLGASVEAQRQLFQH